MVALDETGSDIFQDALSQAKAHIATLVSENEIFKPRNWHRLPDRLILDERIEELFKVVTEKFREDEKDWRSINESLLDLQSLVLGDPSLMDLEVAKVEKVLSNYKNSETENPSTRAKIEERQATKNRPTASRDKTSREQAQKVQHISEEFNELSLKENSEPILMQRKSPIQIFIDKVNAQEMTHRARLAKVCELERTIQDLEPHPNRERDVSCGIASPPGSCNHAHSAEHDSTEYRKHIKGSDKVDHISDDPERGRQKQQVAPQ